MSKGYWLFQFFYLFWSKHIGLDQYLGLENTVTNPQMHINVQTYLILQT